MSETNENDDDAGEKVVREYAKGLEIEISNNKAKTPNRLGGKRSNGKLKQITAPFSLHIKINE